MFIVNVCMSVHVPPTPPTHIYEVRQLSSRARPGEGATYLTAEYHCGHLQGAPLGKLCTDASA